MSEPADLSRLVAPAVVAAVGASAGRERLSGRTIENLKRFGFGGTVVPVNPDRREVAGLPRSRDRRRAQPVDVAFISVPARAVEQSLREAAAAAVPFAIVLTAGYEGPAGPAARTSLERVHRRGARARHARARTELHRRGQPGRRHDAAARHVRPRDAERRAASASSRSPAA